MTPAENHEIQLALRTAAGHERAALDAEASAAKTYEMKMKSAGASAFFAFTLAIRSAPDYQGRKIDDKAIERIYSSNKPRPWWDAHLAKVKVGGEPATREWAKRTILWHIDPEAASARRAAHTARLASGRKVLKEKAERASRGARERPNARSAPTTERMRAVHTAAQEAATGGRTLPSMERSAEEYTRACVNSQQECAGEINRIKVAVAKLREPAQFNEAIELLKAVARDLEKLA